MTACIHRLTEEVLRDLYTTCFVAMHSCCVAKTRTGIMKKPANMQAFEIGAGIFPDRQRR